MVIKGARPRTPDHTRLRPQKQVVFQGVVGASAMTINPGVAALVLLGHDTPIALDGIGLREGGAIRAQFRADARSQPLAHPGE